MTTQIDGIASLKLLNAIIENAKELPVECQDKVLDIVRAMQFTHSILKDDSNNAQRPE